MTESATHFTPDWISPPGETITDLIEERGWTQKELAQRLGYSPKHTSQLINGKVPLTDDAAKRLNSVLGAPVGFWLKREALYRERLAEQEASSRFASWTDWLDDIPVRELMSTQQITKRRITAKAKPEIVRECLSFFGVASPEGWRKRYGGLQPQFRRSREDQSDLGAITAWLRMGEVAAEKQNGPRYDEKTFMQALEEMRTLTVLPPKEFEPRLVDLFQRSGVMLVLVPAICRSYVSGVARWLEPDRPLIQLSLFGKTNDKFWFTLFHEAAHILLHAKTSRSKASVYLDDPAHQSATSQREREANNWARDWLIPPDTARDLSRLTTKAKVSRYAQGIGIHPGIVVGRLQHDKVIEMSWMNGLKDRFHLVDSE